MKHRDRLLGISIARHRDEREPTGFASEFVLHEHDFSNRARLSEVILEIGFRRVKRQIADIEFITHLCLLISFPKRGLR